jgi:hypothetical protein
MASGSLGDLIELESSKKNSTNSKRRLQFYGCSILKLQIGLFSEASFIEKSVRPGMNYVKQLITADLDGSFEHMFFSCPFYSVFSDIGNSLKHTYEALTATIKNQKPSRTSVNSQQSTVNR